jgi:hypothetical protein
MVLGVPPTGGFHVWRLHLNYIIISYAAADQNQGGRKAACYAFS